MNAYDKFFFHIPMKNNIDDDMVNVQIHFEDDNENSSDDYDEYIKERKEEINILSNSINSNISEKSLPEIKSKIFKDKLEKQTDYNVIQDTDFAVEEPPISLIFPYPDEEIPIYIVDTNNDTVPLEKDDELRLPWSPSQISVKKSHQKHEKRSKCTISEHRVIQLKKRKNKRTKKIQQKKLRRIIKTYKPKEKENKGLDKSRRSFSTSEGKDEINRKRRQKTSIKNSQERKPVSSTEITGTTNRKTRDKITSGVNKEDVWSQNGSEGIDQETTQETGKVNSRKNNYISHPGIAEASHRKTREVRKITELISLRSIRQTKLPLSCWLLLIFTSCMAEENKDVTDNKQLETKLMKIPVQFGDSVELSCKIRTASSPKFLAWTKIPNGETVANHANTYPIWKYEVRLHHNLDWMTYNLIIKNFTSADINCTYKCDSDFLSDSVKLYLNNADFIAIPRDNNLKKNVTIHNNVLLLNIIVDTVFPEMQCTARFEDEPVDKWLYVSNSKTSIFYETNITLKLHTNRCSGNIKIICLIGQFSYNFTEYVNECSSNSPVEERQLIRIIGPAIGSVILIVVVCIGCTTMYKRRMILFKTTPPRNGIARMIDIQQSLCPNCVKDLSMTENNTKLEVTTKFNIEEQYDTSGVYDELLTTENSTKSGVTTQLNINETCNPNGVNDNFPTTESQTYSRGTLKHKAKTFRRKPRYK